MTVNAKVGGGIRGRDVVIILFIDWTESHKNPCEYLSTNKGYSLYINIPHIRTMSSSEGYHVAWVAAYSRETYHTFTKKAVNIISRTQGYQQDCPILQQRCATYIIQTLSNIYITTTSSNIGTTEHARYYKNRTPTCVAQRAPLGSFGKHFLIKLTQQNLAGQSLSVWHSYKSKSSLHFVVMVNSRIRMENDQLCVISTSSKAHFHNESKGESTRLQGSP